jgi:hypothetical protein
MKLKLTKPRYGRAPKNPGVIAPEFMALFAEIVHSRKRAYLAAYVQEGGDTEKARQTAGGGHSHSAWMRADPEYAAAYARAKAAVAERREAAIFGAAGGETSDSSLVQALKQLKRPSYGVGPRWPKK